MARLIAEKTTHQQTRVRVLSSEPVSKPPTVNARRAKETNAPAIAPGRETPLRASRFGAAVGDLHAPDGETGDPQDERGQEQQPEHRAWTRGGSGGRCQQPDQRRGVI